jgi:predicted metal-dependent peptidase
MSTKKEVTKNKPKATEIDQAKLNKAVAKAQEMLEQTVVDLIFEEPFYANLIMGMRREFTVELPTLGVNVTDQVNLFVNPYFFAALPEKARYDVLKHEAHHVINNHFVRFRDVEPKVYENKKKSIFDKIEDMQKASNTNKAADAAINEYLPNLPKKVKMFDPNGNAIAVPLEITDDKGNVIPNPDKEAGKPVEAELIFVELLKKKFPNIEHKQTMEYYYEFIKQQEEEDKKNGKDSGMGQYIVLDDHDIWHDSDATEDDITQKVKDAVNKAVEQTADKDMGKLPGDVLEAIEKLNHVPKDWRQDLQRFVARSAEIKIESTRRKRNRRYGIIYPGIKTYPKLNIVAAIDVSGSIGKEEAGQFFAEIERLHNMDITVTILECDSQIQAEYKFDPKKPWTITGRGGTAFKPVFDKIEKDKMDVDGLIYFTDGCNFNEELKKPKFPVLWALTSPFTLDPNIKFGAKTKVEIKKRVRR